MQKENVYMLIPISSMCIHMGPVDNELALVQLMDQQLTSDKTLPETIMMLFDDTNLSQVNPLRAKFLRENINIYLHFMSFLHTDKTQVVEIPPWVRQWPAYAT